jgi:hypothetical protein
MAMKERRELSNLYILNFLISKDIFLRFWQKYFFGGVLGGHSTREVAQEGTLVNATRIRRL